MKFLLAASAVVLVATQTVIAAANAQKIEELTGLKGKFARSLLKVSAPRTDVKVTVEAKRSFHR